MSSLLSKATVGAVGLICKAFLNIGYCSSVTVNGLDNLLGALESDERKLGRGVVTIANHISTLDDPLVWGILPARFYFKSHMTRWTLGASDIMFTNPLFSTFFRNGQVIETFRGNGIFQPAVESAIQRVNKGAWIHLFGEGKVNQPANDSSLHNPVKLARFKWGVGRILMEAVKPPIIIPMWLTGFDKLMPEHRTIPWKFLPRPCVDLSVTFGKPFSAEEIRDKLDCVIRHGQTPDVSHSSHVGMRDPKRPEDKEKNVQVTESAWLGKLATSYADQGMCNGGGEHNMALRIAKVRSAVTAILQYKVEALGNEVVTKKCSA